MGHNTGGYKAANSGAYPDQIVYNMYTTYMQHVRSKQQMVKRDKKIERKKEHRQLSAFNRIE